MATNYYISGDWNLTCDVCSKKVKASISKKRWDGYQVCPDCWEERQPLDFIRARIDKITVPFQRPIPTAEYIFSCDLATGSAYADLATADCSQADQTWGISYQELFESVYCSVGNRTAIPSLAVAGCATASYNIDAYL